MGKKRDNGNKSGGRGRKGETGSWGIAGGNNPLIRKAHDFLHQALASIFYASKLADADSSTLLPRLVLRLVLSLPEPIKGNLRRFKLQRQNDNTWAIHEYRNDLASVLPPLGTGRKIAIPLFNALLDCVFLDHRDLSRLRNIIVSSLGVDPKADDCFPDEDLPIVNEGRSKSGTKRGGRRKPPMRDLLAIAREETLTDEIQRSLERTGTLPTARELAKKFECSASTIVRTRAWKAVMKKPPRDRIPRGKKDKNGFLEAEDHRELKPGDAEN